jgi:hypothetical protein
VRAGVDVWRREVWFVTSGLAVLELEIRVVGRPQGKRTLGPKYVST